MIGEHDFSGAGGEAGFVAELAFPEQGFPFFRFRIELNDEFAVEVMLDFTVFCDDTTLIPLTYRTQGFVRSRGFDIVNARGRVAAAWCSIRMYAIVDHLVFNAQPFLARNVRDPVFHAIVAFLLDLPLPFHFKGTVFLGGDDVSSFAIEVQLPFDDFPAITGRFAIDGGPAGKGFAIE